MREARAREEAEKYERIKKLKGDVEQEIRSNTDENAIRRDASAEMNARTVDAGAQLYEGSNEQRLANAAALEAQKEAMSEAERQRRQRSDGARQAAYEQKLGTEEAVAEERSIWNDRQQGQAQQVLEDTETINESNARMSSAAKGRSDEARDQAESSAEHMADLKHRGDQMAQENQQQVMGEKHALENRQSSLINSADSRRENAKEQVDRTPLNQPRDFADYNRSILAQEYPPGVTEESYTEGNKVIIKRILVQGNKADEYSKVIAKWGTFYFKNGQSITEQIWTNDTEE